jgi:hypothetical protein
MVGTCLLRLHSITNETAFMSGSRRSMGLGPFLFFYYGTLSRNVKSLPEMLLLLMGNF